MGNHFRTSGAGDDAPKTQTGVQGSRFATPDLEGQPVAQAPAQPADQAQPASDPFAYNPTSDVALSGTAGFEPVQAVTARVEQPQAGAATPQPSAGVVRARLVDTTNNRTYALATARLVIGRESSCDITLPDINVSRAHAELRFEPQGVWSLADLGSTNGTFVNGREIGTQLLREGDHITIGMTNLVFDRA